MKKYFFHVYCTTGHNTKLACNKIRSWHVITRGPWALTLCLRTNLAIGQSSRSCTYTLFLPQGGRNWAYFCSKGSGFRDTSHFSKLPDLGMKLGKWPKFQTLHIYSLSTSGVKIDLIFIFLIFTGSVFQYTSPVSKLPYLGMKHDKWPKFQTKLFICSLSTLGGQNRAYFCSTGSSFQDNLAKPENRFALTPPAPTDPVLPNFNHVRICCSGWPGRHSFGFYSNSPQK